MWVVVVAISVRSDGLSTDRSALGLALASALFCRCLPFGCVEQEVGEQALGSLLILANHRLT